MKTVDELAFYEIKIKHFLENTFKMGRGKLELSNVMKRMNLLNIYWDKFQIFHSRLIEEAKLNKELCNSEYFSSKISEKVKVNYTHALNVLKAMISQIRQQESIETISRNNYSIYSEKSSQSQEISSFSTQNTEKHSSTETSLKKLEDETIEKIENTKDENNVVEECLDSLKICEENRNEPSSLLRQSLALEPLPSTSAEISKSPGNRRKSTHKSLLNDDEITFETCVVTDGNGENQKNDSDDDDDDVEDHDSQTLTEDEERPIKRQKLDNDEKYNFNDNPNEDLMRKIAFLRSCVNYIMLNLGYKSFEFKRPISLPWLMSQYYEMKNASKLKDLKSVCESKEESTN